MRTLTRLALVLALAGSACGGGRSTDRSDGSGGSGGGGGAGGGGGGGNNDAASDTSQHDTKTDSPSETAVDKSMPDVTETAPDLGPMPFIWVGDMGACLAKSWEGKPTTMSRPMSVLTGKLRELDDHLYSAGIDASEVGLLTNPCLACFCGPTRRAVARIATADADKASKLGFLPIEDSSGAPIWLWLNPIQCGDNPWDEGGDAEMEAATAWTFFSDTDKVALDWVGFPQPTTPFGTCAACSCPRGDRMLAASPGKLEAEALIKKYMFKLPLP